MVGNLFFCQHLYDTELQLCDFGSAHRAYLQKGSGYLIFAKGNSSCHIKENFWDSPWISLLFHRCIREFLSDKLAALWEVHGSRGAKSSNVICFLAAPCISMCFIAVTLKQGLTLLILAADELSVSTSFLPDKFTDSSVEHNLFWRDGNRSYFLHITESTVTYMSTLSPPGKWGID